MRALRSHVAKSVPECQKVFEAFEDVVGIRYAICRERLASFAVRFAVHILLKGKLCTRRGRHHPRIRGSENPPEQSGGLGGGNLPKRAEVWGAGPLLRYKSTPHASTTSKTEAMAALEGRVTYTMSPAGGSRAPGRLSFELAGRNRC